MDGTAFVYAIYLVFITYDTSLFIYFR